ncbi:uncharacterized protein LOC130663170 [Microplitis mediator]|uniref:uncharacterized protein LOC130663170 n=1 Tax=Microplitis mediator TaxID=375433 RepID=UPI002554405B|nr:uncharacterized protein LOC130663170 [Microplitis mediator]XP_057318266.1 uncharacterized protein LOC130663170 [Microplitis mediator]XP_057318267.1 uncharacterized protein LOC130663170 [Microplitis mediator]XP_057318268.1 uncharacterized protein LOC130663170 [Microplitis mediator]XP_057318269.1 uncharacterized protein LOC130663170 [Microplitis mediator]
MGQFAVVRLEDKNDDKWAAVPESWVTKNEDQCWWPDNDVYFKTVFEIIFNGSSKGWNLRPVGDVYDTDYETLHDAEEKAADLNRQDLEDKRYSETDIKLNAMDFKLNSNYAALYYKQEGITKDIEEIKKILEASKNQVDVNKSTLGAFLPIKNPEDLRKFETLFMTEGWLSQALKELIIILTDDENINQSISKILGAVFSNQLAAQCSWDGQSGIKINDLSIIKIIDVTLKTINANYGGFERDVTLWFQNNRKSVITPD